MTKIIVDKEHIKKEQENLKIKALLIEKEFTDIEKQLWNFLEIADALHTFQKGEKTQVKDVIRLIKKYHVKQLAEVNIASRQLNEALLQGVEAEKKKEQ